MNDLIERIKSNFPKELQDLNQWVLWRMETRNDKPTKVPYSITGQRAESNDLSTWASFGAVCHAFERGNYAGLGYMFHESDPYAGVDFDKCADGESVNSEKYPHILRLDSYTEFSQSGTGVHVIVRGKLPPGGRKSTKQKIEMYDSVRFFCVTGDVVATRPLTVNERQTQLEALHALIFPAKQPANTHANATTTPSGEIPADDQDLLKLMFASKTGAKVQALWDGNRSGYSDDDSAADLALCNYLAFWTGNDAARIDRMFRQSGLYRDKWLRSARTGETYGAGTIARAIAATVKTYEPRVWADEQTSQIIDPDTGEITTLTKTRTYTNGSNGYHAPAVSDFDYAKGGNDMDEDKEEAPQATDDESKLDLDTLFLRQSASDEGNAQCVKALHGDKFLYCGAYEWMENVGTHWQHGEGIAERNLNLAVTQTLIARRVAATKADIEAIIKATKPNATNKENTKRQFKDMVWVAANDFDAEKHLLNCKNGVIDLRSAKLVSHSPSDRFTYCVDAEFNVESSCNVWEGFLSDSVKDYDTIKDWLQMSVGYGVTGYTNEEIMFYLFGPTRSGKGTFTNSMLTMLGKPLAMGVNFSMFTSKRDGDSQNFDLAPLKPARFIAASESGKYNTMNEAVVKQITGNDSIQASFKGKDQFTFFPQFKIWLSSNHPVKGDVDDDAFWGRVKVIEFPNSRLGAEDKSLKERLQSAECRNAILAYAVLGSRMWYNNAAGLVTPTTVKESTAKQRLDLDDVQRWLDERTVKIEKVNTSNAKIYASYTTWCFANGVEPKHSAMFGRSMKNKGFESVSMREPGLANPTRGYKSIGLVADKLPEHSSEL